jgi:hypothetical protein
MHVPPRHTLNGRRTIRMMLAASLCRPSAPYAEREARGPTPRGGTRGGERRAHGRGRASHERSGEPMTGTASASWWSVIKAAGATRGTETYRKVGPPC